MPRIGIGRHICHMQMEQGRGHHESHTRMGHGRKSHNQLVHNKVWPRQVPRLTSRSKWVGETDYMESRVPGKMSKMK